MSERRIEYVPLDEILPAKRNPRMHDLGALSQSIDRFGFVEPMVLDERTGRLVAGHGRVDQLRQRQDGPIPEGVRLDDGQWFVPVIRGWRSADDAEAEAYLIAANRITEVGGWKEGELAEMLSDLAAGPGLEGVGYDGDDLDELLANVPHFAPPDEEHERGEVTCPSCGATFRPERAAS